MDIKEHKTMYWSLLMIVPSIYFWRKLYKTYTSSKRELANEVEFHERHNCVVMYSRARMTGWPPHAEGITININNVTCLLEPYLYFINTAKYSLNVAMMVLLIPQLLDALCEAVGRGVKVRIIVNYDSMKSQKDEYNKLCKSGVSMLAYVSKINDLGSIMHYKYMVKDYDGHKGFACMGSLNLSHINSFLNNFEDVVFTTNQFIVSAFHRNFADCWKMIKADNENIYNKSVLRDSNFLQ